MKIDRSLKFKRGYPNPYGTSHFENGVNFSIQSVHAQSVTLCIFDETGKHLISEVILKPDENKTEHVWHILIHHLPDRFCYAYKINNLPHLLMDPYSIIICSSNVWGSSTVNDYLPLGAVIPKEIFDWEGDSAPHHPNEDLIIYEMHVRGFTQDRTSKVTHKGMFLGVIEKIDHLKQLGITAIELLPIHEFNENEYEKINPVTNQRLYNYWGYSTVNFFSPMNRYASDNKLGKSIIEFKTMVKELHRHGIEVILDVVYNHTSEGNSIGPTHSFRGIDNSIYYILDQEGNYLNYTGCGNTFNCNHPTTRELILTSLRYWVTEMHVDGFRFDLASILTRDVNGMPLSLSPLIEEISLDPILANIKLIAEPWDAVGLYQVGNFNPTSPRWIEWNDKYRDVVRRFMIGKQNHREFATRLSGSEDLYPLRSPYNSLNLITAHDGFTLYDLVSYNEKHNIENGEDNQDGSNNNESWNCGFEGESEDPEINTLRQRQMRNFHLAHMVSIGTPMVLMGDEYGHSKMGNNNTWCQDNELNWFSWKKLEENKEFYRFYRLLIEFRKNHSVLKRLKFLDSNDIQWHGKSPHTLEWDNDASFIAFTLLDKQYDEDLYIAFNAYDHPYRIDIPAPPEGKTWYFVINTSHPPPQDFFTESEAPCALRKHFTMGSFSSILLKAK